jgi:MraZ protein
MPSHPDTIQKPVVFSGEVPAAIDAKKRVTVPAKWRSTSLDEVFIIKSLNRGCLVAMPLQVLQEMGERAASQALTVEDHQTFKDQFFASAMNCPVDSQGRMVLPDDFCKFAQLDKEVLLAGSGAKFDIWNPSAWQQYRQATTPTYATILKNLGL